MPGLRVVFFPFAHIPVIPSAIVPMIVALLIGTAIGASLNFPRRVA